MLKAFSFQLYLIITLSYYHISTFYFCILFSNKSTTMALFKSGNPALNEKTFTKSFT
jgi:hypothetical protein